MMIWQGLGHKDKYFKDSNIWTETCRMKSQPNTQGRTFYKEGSARRKKTPWWVKGEGRVEGRKGVEATERWTKLRVQDEGTRARQLHSLYWPTFREGEGAAHGGRIQAPADAVWIWGPPWIWSVTTSRLVKITRNVWRRLRTDPPPVSMWPMA